MTKSQPPNPHGSGPQWARVNASQSRPKSPHGAGSRPTAPKPTARPAVPKPAPQGATKAGTSRPKPSAKLAPPTQSPQRRPDIVVADAAMSTVTALGLALGRVRTSVPSIAERRDEREKERRAAQRRQWGIVWGRRTGYVVIAAGLVWLVLLSPVFALDPAKVEISGYGTVVEPTQVRAVVDAGEGESLATLSLTQLASELQDIPGVRTAHVERSWPDGLAITLESREPVAAIRSDAGGFDLVDDEGIQVGRASKAPKDLPTIKVPTDNERALAAALGVINALPEDLRERVTSLAARTEDSVAFNLKKGPRVEWGSAEDSEVKIEVLKVLLTSKQASKADIIDVSAPTLPITRNN